MAVSVILVNSAYLAELRRGTLLSCFVVMVCGKGGRRGTPRGTSFFGLSRSCVLDLWKRGTRGTAVPIELAGNSSSHVITLSLFPPDLSVLSF